MRKNIIYSLLLVVAVMFSGCEDRLNIAKHGNMGGQDDFYKTDEQTEQAVASMYSSLKGLYYNWFFTKNLLSDDVWCGGGQRGDNTSMEQLNEYTFDTDNGMVSGLFSSLYGLIYNSNLVIEKVADDSPVKKARHRRGKVFPCMGQFRVGYSLGYSPSG